MRRQAVVVIHGIGEQRPMATLRNLVGTLVGERQLSRPDRMGNLVELRRLRAVPAELPKDEKERVVETDFYELYWAHQIRDTKWTSVVAWIWKLYRQPVHPEHAQFKRLRWLWRVLTGGAVTVLVIVVLLFMYHTQLASLANGLVNPLAAVNPALPRLIRKVAALLIGAGLPLLLIKWAVGSFLVDIVGDAARYLSPEPANVEARQNVLAAGIELLTKLHEDPFLDRIVVVGHSLGSIIGYDLLRAFFAIQNEHVLIDAKALKELTKAGEALITADPRRRGGEVPAAAAVRAGLWRDDHFPDALTQFRDEQYRVFKVCREFALNPRQKPVSRRWLVSDFITMGSPLAYADFLRRATRADHERAVARGDAPSCPPEPMADLDPRTPANKPIGYAYVNYVDTYIRLHHAALFALTRWTNIYYPGDVAGGPLRELFGVGIEDHQLMPQDSDGDGRWTDSFGSHVRYWRTEDGKVPLDAARDLLGRIVFEAAWTPPAEMATHRPVNLTATRYREAPHDPWSSREKR